MSFEATASRPLRRLLQLTWRYRGQCLLMFFSQLLLLALALGGLSASGLCVDVIRHALDPSAPEPRWPLGASLSQHATRDQLLVIGGAVLAFGVLHAGLSYLYAVQSARVLHLRLVPELRAQVFDKLQRLSLRFHRESGAASLINRVTSDVQAARSFVDGVLLQGGVLSFTLLAYAAFMARSHLGLTLACLAGTPVIFLLTRRFSAWARPAYRATRRRVDAMVTAMSEGIAGVMVTKVFGREREELARFQAKNLAIVEQQESIFRRASHYSAAVHFSSQANLAVLLGYGGVLVARDEILLGDLVVFAGLLQQFSSQVSAMARVVNTLSQSLAGARRVFEVLDAPLDLVGPSGQSAGASEAPRGELAFEQVVYETPEGQRVLDGIDLKVPAGTCLGIVGATGAGKTSLLGLVPRFFDPTRGRVLLDGRDVRDYDPRELRRHVGVVFQNTRLFRQSVADNVRFGAPGASRAAVERAAEVAGVGEFVAGLPEGYDSVLAEEALDLSGGQRQRIALARAVLIDPRVLILDDPTSSLDPKTENQVLRSLERVSRGRTTLLVASRISTLRHADRIVVMDAGRVVESGTHAELLGRDGIYRRIARLQGYGETAVASARGELSEQLA